MAQRESKDRAALALIYGFLGVPGGIILVLSLVLMISMGTLALEDERFSNLSVLIGMMVAGFLLSLGASMVFLTAVLGKEKDYRLPNHRLPALFALDFGVQITLALMLTCGCSAVRTAGSGGSEVRIVALALLALASGTGVGVLLRTRTTLFKKWKAEAAGARLEE